MGMFGKLMFWKKNDELGLGDELALPKGGFPGDEFGDSPKNNFPGMQQQQGMPEPRIESFDNARIMPQQQYPQQQAMYGYGGNKDLELISAKLDSLRATLDNINQRIAGLERVAYGEDNRRRNW